MQGNEDSIERLPADPAVIEYSVAQAEKSRQLNAGVNLLPQLVDAECATTDDELRLFMCWQTRVMLAPSLTSAFLELPSEKYRELMEPDNAGSDAPDIDEPRRRQRVSWDDSSVVADRDLVQSLTPVVSTSDFAALLVALFSSRWWRVEDVEDGVDRSVTTLRNYTLMPWRGSTPQAYGRVPGTGRRVIMAAVGGKSWGEAQYTRTADGLSGPSPFVGVGDAGYSRSTTSVPEMVAAALPANLMRSASRASSC